MDTATNVSELVKGITFLDAIFWLKEAINSLSPNVVPNCFRKSGFQLNQPHFDSEDDNALSDLRALMEQGGFDDLTTEEFVDFDNTVLTESDTEFNALSKPASENCDDDDEEGGREKCHCMRHVIACNQHKFTIFLINHCKLNYKKHSS